MTSTEYALAFGLPGARGADEFPNSPAFVDRSLRVSAVLGILVERLRARFGVAVDILSSQLYPVLPAGGGEFYRAIEMSSRLRAEVAAAVDGGRVTLLSTGDADYAVHPLRGGRTVRGVVGLLAVRRTPPAGSAGPAGSASPQDDGTEPWVDVLKAAIEADIAASEGLREERLHARRTSAALKFLGQLVRIESEEDLARAVVHAAAVWFDIDARLYRRDLSGAFVLHTTLPGVVEPRGGRIDAALLGGGSRPVSVQVGAEAADLGWASPEALLVPILVNGSVDWLLALGGVLPPDAQLVFEIVGQTIGSHLSRMDVSDRSAIRRRFRAVLNRPDGPCELVALDALRQVIEETGAAAGLITLVDQGGSRRLAAVGTLRPSEAPPAEPVFDPEQFALAIPLARGRSAVLQLAASERPLDAAAARAVAEAVPLLQVFLAGALHPESPQMADLDVPAGFLARISEELERAKRFDLGLSMLLVDLEPHSADARAVGEVLAGVRSELRGSDILGLVDQRRIAALLVHTDGAGVSAAVCRLRLRLERLAKTSGVSGLRLGRAALSGDCRTVSELLSRASLNVEAVVAS